jgi:hypothetical protein
MCVTGTHDSTTNTDTCERFSPTGMTAAMDWTGAPLMGRYALGDFVHGVTEQLWMDCDVSHD